MKQFFSYFGSKVSLAKHYPAPLHDTIIEPFAGSAGYSCMYPERSILLYDLDPVVVSVWDFLIRATRRDILSLPLDVTEVSKLSQPERNFIGFWWVRCGANPAKKPVAWAASGLYPYSFWSEKTRERIASQVGGIKHWRIEHWSFERAAPVLGTWFIDPPYQKRGARYRFGSKGIDYAALAAWVTSLPGQVIACESDGANYLPFEHCFHNSTVKYRRVKRTVEEVVFVRDGI